MLIEKNNALQLISTNRKIFFLWGFPDSPGPWLPEKFSKNGAFDLFLDSSQEKFRKIPLLPKMIFCVALKAGWNEKDKK